MSKKQSQPAPQKKEDPPQEVKAPPKKVEAPKKTDPIKKAEPVPTLPAQFDPDKYVKANCPRQEVIELKQAFDIFDEDLSGSIEPQELKIAFEAMGLHTQSKLIYQVLGELDQDNSGGIDFDEFFKLATTRHTVRETKADLQRAFNLFDWNREGRITWDELKRVAQDLGEYEDDDQVRKCFAKGDLDSDGFVTFDDFYQIMTNSKTYYQ